MVLKSFHTLISDEFVSCFHAHNFFCQLPHLPSLVMDWWRHAASLCCDQLHPSDWSCSVILLTRAVWVDRPDLAGRCWWLPLSAKLWYQLWVTVRVTGASRQSSWLVLCLLLCKFQYSQVQTTLDHVPHRDITMDKVLSQNLVCT